MDPDWMSRCNVCPIENGGYSSDRYVSWSPKVGDFACKSPGLLRLITSQNSYHGACSCRICGCRVELRQNFPKFIELKVVPVLPYPIFEPNVRICARSWRRYHKSASVLHVEFIVFFPKFILIRSPLFWKFRGFVDMSWFHHQKVQQENWPPTTT